MQSIKIGQTVIPYSIRESLKARLKQIIVTPGMVEVVVPLATPAAVVRKFVEAKKDKLLLTYAKIEEQARQRAEHNPVCYATGAKVAYRGRLTKLTVRRAAVPDIEVSFKTGFVVTLPLKGVCGEHQVKAALESWLQARVHSDASAFCAIYAEKSGLKPKSIRVKNQQHLWGSLSKDGVINLNWKLVHFPKQILEYVTVHEICHLQYRNHSPAFWNLLASLLPGYNEFKTWLEEKDANLL